MKYNNVFIIFYAACSISLSLCSDITTTMFGSVTNIMPAAFGDFNSDELTDLFVISDDGLEVKIYLGTTKEPYFETNANLRCKFEDSTYKVTSIAPGDFDGDALMDMMVTARLTTKSSNPNISQVFIHWGQLESQENRLNCTQQPLLTTYDEPLIIDYRLNMITDLFGTDENGKKAIWNFSKEKANFSKIFLSEGQQEHLKMPHSNAFLDWNDDNSPDLFLTGETMYEIWLSDNSMRDPNFKHAMNISYPSQVLSNMATMGSTLLIDLETTNDMIPVVPLYYPINRTSFIYAYIDEVWMNLEVDFADDSKDVWTFGTGSALRYRQTVTLRAGDFNNDGYIDLLATLEKIDNETFKTFKTFLLENVAYTGENYALKRTFQVRWDQLSPNNENAVLGTFFDFMQDGIMDIIFVQFQNNGYNVSAFKNSLDYDANFIKVMVISEMTNTTLEMPQETLLGKKRFFGSNLPGPRVSYRTITQDGLLLQGCSSQLPQSAHFALYLPYTIFGLGRTPNFVEDLVIGMFNQTRTLTQIIPNSQLVIIIPDNAATNPSRWRAQLFVTPSKIVWQTVFALTGTCVVIAIIICVLHWKERREDKLEKLQEAHRFHFDAM